MPERSTHEIMAEIAEWESTLRDIEALPETQEPPLLGIKGLAVGLLSAFAFYGVLYLVIQLACRLATLF